MNNHNIKEENFIVSYENIYLGMYLGMDWIYLNSLTFDNNLEYKNILFDIYNQPLKKMIQPHFHNVCRKLMNEEL